MADNSKRSGVVELTTEADADQATVHIYTAQFWGEKQADTYSDFLDHVMQEIANNPDMAPLVPDFDDVRSYVARWKNTRQGHRIFYKETDSGIFVLRFCIRQ